MKKTVLITTLLAVLALPALAQRGATTTQARSGVLRSHIRSLGTVGAEGRYEINSVRVRGLDSPNISSVIIYDTVTDQILVVGPATGPGLGGALVSGAASVGGNFLFGASLRPDKTSVDNSSESDSDSSSSAKGGNSSAKSSNSNVNINSNSNVANSSSASSAKNKNSNSNVNTVSPSPARCNHTRNCGHRR